MLPSWFGAIGVITSSNFDVILHQNVLLDDVKDLQSSILMFVSLILVCIL